MKIDQIEIQKLACVRESNTSVCLWLITLNKKKSFTTFATSLFLTSLSTVMQGISAACETLI